MPKRTSKADAKAKIGGVLTPPSARALRIADLFCGAGGTSEGACQAARSCGYTPELTAINHWPVAVETHSRNHPTSRHLCTTIDNVNPRDLYRPGELDLLWASPECTHHSVARGGKPIHDQSRATAWCVTRWAEALRPPVILVENVPEFATWGPLDYRGRPLKSRKGEVFEAWKNSLRALGYRVEARILCAADYGDPTTRRRLFVQCVRGRSELRWPEPTHAPAVGSVLPRWRAAREIIDFSLPAPSIYDRARPLSPKTMSRIMAGLQKFGLKPFIVPPEGVFRGNRVREVDEPIQTVTASRGGGHIAQPFIVAWDHQSGTGTWSSDDPLSTVTTKARHGVVQPFLVELRGTSASQIASTARSIDEPVPTVTTSGAHAALAQPFLVQVAHGNGKDSNGDARRARSADEPLPTVCGTRGEWALCDPALLPQQSDGRLRPVTEPCPTVAASGAIALVEPFLVKYYGTGVASSVGDPLDTVTTKDRHALVRPQVMINGERYLLDIGFRMLQPRELASAQGFPADYTFTGTKTDQVKQIGNAVPCGLARALVEAVLRR